MEKFIFLKDLANFIDYFIPFSKLARKIKELNFNRNGNNKVYLINGNERRRIKMNGVIKGFEIVFNGKNNLVEIEEPFTFQQVRMIVTCDNNHFSIKKNSFISNAYTNISTGSTIEIGENFKSIHDGRFFAGGIASIKIGNNCLFSRRLCIYPGDGHILYNKDTNNVENPI